MKFENCLGAERLQYPKHGKSTQKYFRSLELIGLLLCVSRAKLFKYNSNLFYLCHRKYY